MKYEEPWYMAMTRALTSRIRNLEEERDELIDHANEAAELYEAAVVNHDELQAENAELAAQLRETTKELGRALTRGAMLHYANERLREMVPDESWRDAASVDPKFSNLPIPAGAIVRCKSDGEPMYRLTGRVDSTRVISASLFEPIGEAPPLVDGVPAPPHSCGTPWFGEWVQRPWGDDE